MLFIRKLIKDQKGATAIEYGLIAALIAVAAITAMQGLGNQLSTTFTTASTKMANAPAAAPATPAPAPAN
jgi:pilus assembly protein Flp/PilA